MGPWGCGADSPAGLAQLGDEFSLPDTLKLLCAIEDTGHFLLSATCICALVPWLNSKVLLVWVGYVIYSF